MATREVGPHSGAPSRRHGRHRARRLLLLIGVLLGIAGGAWWWTHPGAFESGAGGGMEMDAAPLADFPVHVGFAHNGSSGRSETVTLRAVHVRLRDNTAGATATVALCTRRPVPSGTLTLGTDMAKDVPDLREYCTSLRPVRPGTKMRLDHGRQYLIASLTPSRPGRAVFAEADLTYSRDARHLYQRGTQHVEIGAITTIKAGD